MNDNERVNMKREAGAVKRWHVLPHIGEDTVASHSWNAAQLLLELNPEASKQLIIYMLDHDVAERWMGDVPTFCKKAFPLVHKALHDAEAKIEDELCLQSAHLLTDEEHHWAEAIDALESMLWCCEQDNMGNRNVRDTMKYLDEYLLKSGWIPAAVLVFYRNYRSKRTTDYPIGGIPKHG